MKAILEKVAFYLGYGVTMLALVGALFLIWEIEAIPVLKFILVMPIIFVAALLSMSIDEYHEQHT